MLDSVLHLHNGEVLFARQAGLGAILVLWLGDVDCWRLCLVLLHQLGRHADLLLWLFFQALVNRKDLLTDFVLGGLLVLIVLGGHVGYVVVLLDDLLFNAIKEVLVV